MHVSGKSLAKIGYRKGKVEFAYHINNKYWKEF